MRARILDGECLHRSRHNRSVGARHRHERLAMPASRPLAMGHWLHGWSGLRCYLSPRQVNQHRSADSEVRAGAGHNSQDQEKTGACTRAHVADATVVQKYTALFA